MDKQLVKTKEEIEKQLYDLLDDLLEYGNQDGSIKDLKINLEKEEVHITLSLWYDEDNKQYLFQGY